MNNPYAHLLSPLKVGNTVFRNRLVVTPSMAHFIQGPETYPSQAMINYFAQRAKAGAALVTVGCVLPRERFLETAQAPKFDYSNIKGRNYFCKLTEAIHFYGAKAELTLDPTDIPGWDASPDRPLGQPQGAGFPVVPAKEIPRNMLKKMVEEYAEQAVIAKQCGFDAVFIHASYRFFLISRFLSPITNLRTDEFGGSRENRVRFLKMICTRIKERCGSDFLIEVSMSGEETDGITPEDVIAWARMLEGQVDILQIRAGDIDSSHPTGFTPERTPFLKLAAAVKASNPPMAITTVGGFLNFEDGERALAEGKADLIGGARAWISNEYYGIKAYENRPQDIVPCLRCNKCHVSSRGCTYNSVCSVNPRWGSISTTIDRIPDVPAKLQKIAVVGGGPAGMEAAQIACGRGHSVTLYEKSDALGGQLIHAAFADFKWPLNQFKQYMVRKTIESGVDVRLNTEASPELLRSRGFDYVILAIGPHSVVPPIPGLEKVPYRFAADVFIQNATDELEKDIVIIGGGEIGVETGLYLAQAGHRVHIVEQLEALCRNATPVHYRATVENYWLAQENFSFTVNATVIGVSPEGVAYRDGMGSDRFIPAGSVLLAVGSRPQNELLLRYQGIAPYVICVGDCEKPGSVQTAMRTGYAAGIRF